MPAPREGVAGHTAYFERPPEKLVLDGYRHLIRGAALSSADHLTKAQLLYRGVLGDADGEKAIMALATFVRTLDQCAACPLNVYRPGSHRICRDETLVMAMIAGIQNADEPTVTFCLEKLCCRDLRDRAILAAGAFALTLKYMDQVMLPIPVHVVERILARSGLGTLDGFTSGTIH